MAKDAGVNFEMMPIPGAENVGGEGWSTVDTSMLYIPTTSAHKDGAWDFMKYMCMGDGNKLFCKLKGDLPPTKALLEDQEIVSLSPAQSVFSGIVAKNNLGALPQSLHTVEYSKAIKDAVETVLLGDSTEQALTKMKEAVSAIK